MFISYKNYISYFFQWHKFEQISYFFSNNILANFLFFQWQILTKILCYSDMNFNKDPIFSVTWIFTKILFFQWHKFLTNIIFFSVTIPYAPTNVLAVQQHDEIHVTWDPPKDGTAPINKYDIKYYTSIDSKILTITVVSKSALQLVSAPINACTVHLQ